MLPEAQEEILFSRQDLRQLGKTENCINIGGGGGGRGHKTDIRERSRLSHRMDRKWLPTGAMEVTFGSISFPSLTTEASSSSKG